MSNGFEKHGVEHLSASSLNLWAAEPAVWAMERLLGHRSPPSALMARGKAVEDGVHAGLIDASMPTQACVQRALAAYDREMTLNPDERRDNERAQIQGYVEHGLAELRQYGVPSVNAIKDVYAQYDAERADHRGELPVVSCTGSEPMKDRFGTNYRPAFKIVQWVERPKDLPNRSPVDAADVWRGGNGAGPSVAKSPAQRTPAGAGAGS